MLYCRFESYWLSPGSPLGHRVGRCTPPSVPGWVWASRGASGSCVVVCSVSPASPALHAAPGRGARSAVVETAQLKYCCRKVDPTPTAALFYVPIQPLFWIWAPSPVPHVSLSLPSHGLPFSPTVTEWCRSHSAFKASWCTCVCVCEHTLSCLSFSSIIALSSGVGPASMHTIHCCDHTTSHIGLGSSCVYYRGVNINNYYVP